MPYCPKCDMEFVEGMTVCTDCGGPLAESKEAADAARLEQERLKEEEMRRRCEELVGKTEELSEGETLNVSHERTAPSKAYVNKGQRYEDMASSASAFFIVGGILSAAAILCLTGIIRLPMAGFSKYTFQGILVFMAIGSFLIAVSSKKSAGVLKSEAADEEKETEEILQWFLKTYSAGELDEKLLSEDPDLNDEELSLKRFELIQDLLITGRDLPDQSYADALCDMLYSRLYDKES